MTESCPTTERLVAVLRGEPQGGDTELAEHLSECRGCQAKLEVLAGGTGWLAATARTHRAGDTDSSAFLQRAMQALESSAGNVRAEASAPPSLDFLQPANEPGVLGRFGPYEVLEHIASGGMGIVLKARDPALDRIVAVKILTPALAANSLARARFVREARAAAAVVHEHVVPIYAVDEAAGLPYLVMQFVKGRSLAERIRATGPLRLEEILRIGAQTAAGLAAAHAQGLIHRDVKPGNILLENSVERVKLTDFGLARAADDTGLTRTGELAGTPEFMSPEQAGNVAVDHRSDLFSFGSVLYAMCTGCSPFQATSVIAAVRKVCDEHPPPVHELNSAIPRWLSDIVAKLMAKAPAERFQSAQEVAELLERHLAQVQHGGPGELPTTSRRWKTSVRAGRLALGAAICVVILGLSFFTLRHRGGGPTTKDNSQTSSPNPVPEPFLVRTESGTSLGAFTNIADALAAIPSSGVVELRWNGPREMPPVTLPSKPLTLRAAKGFLPVWVHTSLSVSAISASRALTVEDIKLSLRPDATALAGRSRGPPGLGPSGVGLISISDAPLRLSRCALQLPNPRLQPRTSPLAAAGLSGVVLNNAATCEVENSALLADSWTAIFWRQTVQTNAPTADGANETGLSLSNCVVTAFRSFSVELPENSRKRLRMVRNTFRGMHLVEFPVTTEAGGISVFAQANLFSTATIVVDRRASGREGLTASMRWQGSDNLFSLSRPRGGRPGRPGGYIVLNNTSGPATLAQWNQWWPQPETGSREASVEFADAPDTTSDAGGAALARTAHKIISLTVTDGGPPLSADQWSRFGADIGNVGPRAR